MRELCVLSSRFRWASKSARKNRVHQKPKHTPAQGRFLITRGPCVSFGQACPQPAAPSVGRLEVRGHVSWPPSPALLAEMFARAQRHRDFPLRSPREVTGLGHPRTHTAARLRTQTQGTAESCATRHPHSELHLRLLSSPIKWHRRDRNRKGRHGDSTSAHENPTELGNWKEDTGTSSAVCRQLGTRGRGAEPASQHVPISGA